MAATAEKLVPWIRTLLTAPPASVSGLKLQDYLAGIPRLESLANVPSGTPVLVRGDVDAKPGAAVGEGDIRLRSMVETLEFGRKRGWKQIIFGHIGRKPDGSLNKVAKRLGEILKCDVPLITDWLDESTTTVLPVVKETIDKAAPGSIIMLENTRKYGIERVLWEAGPDDAEKVAPQLAKLVDELSTKVANVYVNEALSAGSMDASSTVVPAGMKQVALGAYVAGEFDKPMQRCMNADFVFFSGLKTDKLDDLRAVVDRGVVKWVFVAGNFVLALKKADAELAGKEFSMGLAEKPENAKQPWYIERSRVEQAKQLLVDGRAKGIQFIMPVDFTLGDGTASPTIGPDQQQFDVGPATSEHFAAAIGRYIDEVKKRPAGSPPPAAFYNGVLGMFEDPRFENGTKNFMPQLKRLKDAGVEVYIGGGEGGAAMEKYGSPDWITHCFTAGGTVLNALGSAPVPYLQALYMAAKK
ncbi:MAG: phosphoglycerate kinase [Planctomycetes bacterium]|nr:phosphoglycerate kinase [Planctomycetota bacterium]